MRKTVYAALSFVCVSLVMFCGAVSGGEGEAGFKSSYYNTFSLDKLDVTVPDDSAEAKKTVSFHFTPEQVRGKHVTFSAEVKCDMGNPTRKWGGGMFVVWVPDVDGKKGMWEHKYVGAGIKPWRELRMDISFPDCTPRAVFYLGISGSRGTVHYRNIKITCGDTMLSFEKIANMGFADEVAGDQKGGWHDGGPAYDASKFPLSSKTFANVPFKVIDPKTNNGKSIIVFKCPKLAGGVTEAEFNLPEGTSGKYVYLMHAAAWGQKKGTITGRIVLTGEGGKTIELPVVYGKDLTEWWGAKPAENAVIGTQVAAQSGIGAVYVSRFEIPADFGTIENIAFKKEQGARAMWLLVAASISDVKYKYPQAQKLVMKADEVWKPLPIEYHPVPKVGSALDFSAFYKNEPVGKFGRVVISKDGRFEFEKRPGEPVRFMSVGSGRDFGTFFGTSVEMADHEMIDRYVEQMRLAGYNMLRFWANKLHGTGWRENKAFEFQPDVLDRVDYLFHRLKENGIYVLLSIGDPTIGFDNCYPWGGAKKNGWNIYTNQRDFDAWCKGSEIILNHTNPYTKMRWIDDPIISMIDCNNELEFVFTRAGDDFAPLFREFLKKKYKTFDALKKAWGTDADNLGSFEDIKTFHPVGRDKPGQLNKDRALFVTEQERGIYNREKAFLRKLGYVGPVTTFLMGKSMRNCGVRKDFDFVSQNGYHAHPVGTGGVTKGRTVAQISSIGASANIIRSFLAARLYNKPLLLSEHGHVFWNKYRYEQGMIMGGYAALNSFDAMTAFFMPVTTHQSYRMTPFEMRHDPVSRASELMTNLLYRRGDAKSSKFTTRIRMDLDDAISKDEVAAGISSTQLRMGLLGNCFVDQTALPVKKNELLLMRTGGSSTAVRRADSNVVDTEDKAFDLDAVIGDLKKRGFLSQSNISSFDKGIYQSSTEEILMKVNKNFMRIDTQRFQGICGEAGTTAKMKNIEVKSMNRRGCIALASIDDHKSLDSAKRMLLFVVTNVLNSGMSFESSDQMTRIESGTLPLLMETGQFSVAISTPLAKKMKIYAVALDGTRIDEIPAQTVDGGIVLDIDTAKIKNGPAMYFELSSD